LRPLSSPLNRPQDTTLHELLLCPLLAGRSVTANRQEDYGN
jgi:hypothetical protein